MSKSTKIPNVRFNLKSKDPQDQETLIYAMFRYKHGLLKYSTGEKVLPKYWDHGARKAKNVKNHPEYLDMNDRLNDLAKLIRKVYADHNFGDIAVPEFRQKLKVMEGRVKIEPKEVDKPLSLFEFIDQYIEEKKQNPTITRGTWKNHITHKNHLYNYSLQCGYRLDFDTIDWHFRRDYENWMYRETDASINHAAKSITELTHFLNEAKKRKLYDGDIHTEKGWHVAKKEVDKKFALSFEELAKLYAYDLSDNKKLEKVRDLFLIGAYSGLRYSDFNRISNKHFVKEDGIEMIEISTEKTDHRVTIPLIPILTKLIKKYNYNPPKISNQKFNDYIKEACEAAGIDRVINFSTYKGGKMKSNSKPIYEIIGSHNARRSFATNFYKLGIPSIHLMSITGHSTEAQFMKYVCITGRENAKTVAKQVAMRMKESNLKVV